MYTFLSGMNVLLLWLAFVFWVVTYKFVFHVFIQFLQLILLLAAVFALLETGFPCIQSFQFPFLRIYFIFFSYRTKGNI